MATGEDPAEDLLAGLVDKSLVVIEAPQASEYRYHLLETIRAYGLEALTRSGEDRPVRAAHASYYLQLTRAATAGLRGVDMALWLDRLRTEHGNLRAAMEWSLTSRDDETAATLAGSLYPFWDLHGHYREGLSWLQRVLAPGRQVSPIMRARVLMGTATLAVIQGDLEQGYSACLLAAEASRVNGDGPGLAHALQYLGFISTCTGDLEEARPPLVESEDLLTAQAGATWEHAWAQFFLATLGLAESRFDEAADHASKAERIVGQTGDQELLAWTAAIRGASAWGRDKFPNAARDLRQSVHAFSALGGLWGLSLAMLFSGFVLAGADRADVAVELISSSEAVRESAGIGMLPFVGHWRDAELARLRKRVSAETFADAWRTGEAWGSGDAAKTTEAALGACCRRGSRRGDRRRLWSQSARARPDMPFRGVVVLVHWALSTLRLSWWPIRRRQSRSADVSRSAPSRSRPLSARLVAQILAPVSRCSSPVCHSSGRPGLPLWAAPRRTSSIPA